MTPDPGTFGTDEQIRLQLKSIAMRDEIERTPGLSHSGRAVGSDDPKTLGWDVLARHLAEDGVVVVRCATPEVAQTTRDWGATLGSLHEWAVMLGDAAPLREAATLLMTRALPEGWIDLSPDEMARDDRLSQMQTHLVDAGIAPLALTCLRGEVFPSACVGIADADGTLVAIANASMQYNHFSQWHDTAWIGLVAVTPGHRGLGLGVRASAAATLAALDHLGAARTMAFVADDNAPSRAMLQRVGMSLSPYRTIAIGRRFTR